MFERVDEKWIARFENRLISEVDTVWNERLWTHESQVDGRKESEVPWAYSRRFQHARFFDDGYECYGDGPDFENRPRMKCTNMPFEIADFD